MDDGLKKMLIGMAAGALGLGVTACSSEPSSEAAPTSDETQTTGDEPALPAEPGSAPDLQATTPSPEPSPQRAPDLEADPDQGSGESSCGAGSCGSPE